MAMGLDMVNLWLHKRCQCVAVQNGLLRRDEVAENVPTALTDDHVPTALTNDHVQSSSVSNCDCDTNNCTSADLCDWVSN